MYSVLLVLHSFIRWLVLVALLFSLFRAYRGWFYKREFSAFDNVIRHWTATMAHIQLFVGLTLYCISPIVKYFFQDKADAHRQSAFFGMEHSLMMLTAVVLITIGSAKAKRKPTDKEKFRTMAIWFSVGLLIILVAIPWPFSPLTGRPWVRGF